VASEPLRTQQTIRFEGDFELDLGAYELRRADRVLRLERIPMEILLLLIEQRGQLVTRELIVERIWGNGVFLDTDNSINGAVRKIRQALKDDPERPRFVQTVTGKGYRFIAPAAGGQSGVGNGGQTSEGVPVLNPTNGGATPALPLPRQIATQAPVHSRTKIPAPVALLALVVISLALWLAPMLSRRTSAAPPLRNIAVLPLDNLTGDASQEYLVDGMTEQLITDLAQVSALRVTSRTSVMRYKGTKKSLPEIAQELKVDGIVEGSVMRSGGRVRITAQLINASTDQHIWAETYEADPGDILKLQSEVAEAIAHQVRAQLTPQQEAQLRSARPVNPGAYEAYARGRYYFTNDFTEPEKLKMAKSYFEESIRKDPNFALAYSGLADSYVYMALYGSRDTSPDAAYQLAKQALRKAMDLDDSIGETYDTLGTLSWRFEWDWNAAERNFDRSIALAPSYSCAHEDRAIYLAFTGRRNEALAELAKSKQLDPGPGSTMVASGVYYQLRDFEELVEASRRGVVSNPNEWSQHYQLGVGYEGTGKPLEAISEYQKAVELSDGDLDVTASLAHAFAVIGRRAEAKKMLGDLERKSKTIHVSPYVIATIYAGLGEKDKAFEFLEKAYRERSLELSWHLKADLRIDNLRSDPRFQRLLRRVGLPA
jgi:TolB-like protein/DNA-binding winged helix-turn-helix (wHTH) protein/Flp pilus assembly protein TadD